MKLTTTLTIGLISCTACNDNKKIEATTNQDTTVTYVDSTTLTSEANLSITTPPTTTTDSTLNENGELIEEKGELVYVSKNQFSFISQPYDFYLDANTIEGLLGEKAETKVEEFDATEDYSAYTYTTITLEDTKISFYDFAGKHFSNITTPLLPLKDGIKIGMKKDNFCTTMGFNDANASKTSTYRLVDDYGNMEFSFRADTLYLIYAHYEEGD